MPRCPTLLPAAVVTAALALLPASAGAGPNAVPPEATAIRKDGTCPRSPESQGACSQHGGGAFRLKAQ